ncbi:MAG: EamA family transporter [Flavobacteriaceae bacterium]|nr:EamA family transporter [Flavobacteriaceae bacterium]OUX40386.1 MAG: EamA family transporter [Flavobacteriaceae bacterium TMED265]
MNKRKQYLIIACFFAIYVIWGSTYLLNKVAVAQLPPFMLASFRFVIAGGLIFLFCFLRNMSLKISKKQLINTAIAGFLFLSVGNGIVVWALQIVDSGFASLLISSQPLVILLLMYILYRKPIQKSSIIGVIIGVFGIYLLVNQEQMIQSSDTITGAAVIIFCVFTWAYASIFVGKADLPQNYFVNTAYQMVIGGFVLLIMSLGANEEWVMPRSWNHQTWLSIIGLILFGSIVAFTSFNYLLKTVSPEMVATSTYINPVVAMFLGWLVLKETVTTQSIIAGVILLTGVYFINMKRNIQVYFRFNSIRRVNRRKKE